MLRKMLPILFLTFFTSLTLTFITIPFFHDGFFPTMDDVQVVRIDEMSRELASGQFPVRYVDQLGNGGGYMLFHFYAPFVYYLGAFYHIVGFPLVAATKLVFLTGYFVGTAGIVVFLRRYTDWIATTIGTMLFLTSTYLAYDVYTRGALAEFFAFCLLPWLFWAFLKMKEQHGWSHVLIAGFFYGLLVITHNITSFTASIIVALLLLLPPYSQTITRWFIVAGIIGLGISAFFWMPVVFEQKYTILSTVDFVTEQYKSNFLNPLQIGGLQKILWGFKPPLLGTGLFFGLIGSVILYFCGQLKPRFFNRRYRQNPAKRRQPTAFKPWRRRHCSSVAKRNRELPFDQAGVASSRLVLCQLTETFARTITKETVFLFTLVGSALSLILIWSISKPVWDVLPYMRFMQFPWRYLSITTVLAVFAIALFLQGIRLVWVRIVVGSLLLLPAITLHYSYLRPTTYTYIGKYYAEDRCRSTSWAQEQLPRWVIACLPKNNTLPVVESLSPNVHVVTSQLSNNGRAIEFTTRGGGNILIRKYFYPAWRATVDGQPAAINIEGIHGLIRVSIPDGLHQVDVRFSNVPLWYFANSVTVVTLLCILCFFVVKGIRFIIDHTSMERV